jgi:uncharacterized membrane protein YgdD (TMEM256/DUF423 family)
MPRPGLWIAVGALLGLTAVALGAFAAHALEAAGDARAVDLVATGSRYQATHALALVGCGLLALQAGSGTPAARWAGRGAVLFLAGCLLFCGALYGIALAGWPLGMVAPVGGTAFMAGWACLGLAGWHAGRISG